MRRASGIARNLLIFVVGSTTLVAQDAPAPFPVSATIDEPTIAGRAVALDAQHKLLPWPMPDDTGYSYAGYFLSQWTILWDQYDGAAIEIPRTGLRAGFDVYNAGMKEATIEISSPGVRELAVTVKPGELRRVPTGWRDPSSKVVLRFENGEGLGFDNLAFRRE